MDRLNNNEPDSLENINEKPNEFTEESTTSNDKDLKSENSRKMEEKRVEREEADNKSDDLLLVVDGAKIKFNAHLGEFKVLSDVPTTQGKLTGTVVEKQIANFTFYDGFKMISLTEWQDFGTALVQDHYVLLKKSKLPGVGKMPGNIPPETGNIEFVNSGQINEPESIETLGAPVPKQEDKKNGYYYNYDGLYEGNVSGQKIGDNNDVYVCEGKGVEADTFVNPQKLTSHYEKFIKDSSTTYGESSAAYNVIDQYEFFAIASVHKRNKTAYGVNSAAAKKFRDLSDVSRNKNDAMKYAIAGEINSLIGGKDFSNGAKQWDGAEQTHIPDDNPDLSSNGRFMFKVNVMGWDITDGHYASWKLAISKKFGDKYFTAPQKKYAVSNYKGMTNKNKIRLVSVAQYGLTMFWKEVDVTKPKEK